MTDTPTDTALPREVPLCNCPAAGTSYLDRHAYGCLWRTWRVSQERQAAADVKARHPFDWRYDPKYSGRRRGSF